MILQGIGQSLGAVGDVLNTPFKLAGGLLQIGVGAATLPFRMAGGLFGMGMGMMSPAAMYGAQSGIMPFL
jgi:hypothetical protein